MNAGFPSVSVVVPFFRQGDLVSHVVELLRAIDYPRVDFLLVDDGSGDDTPARLAAECAKDGRFRTIALPQNLGPGGARNAGIAQAHGEYVWFADSDDTWEPSVLRTLIHTAQTADAEIVIARAVWTTPTGSRGRFTDGFDSPRQLTPSEAFDAILADDVRGYLWNKLFRRSVLDATIFPAQRTREDLCGLLIALQRAQRIAAIPDVVYHHMERQNSVSRSPDISVNDSLAAKAMVHDVAASLPPTRLRAQLLDFYDFRSWILDDVRLAVRAGDEALLTESLSRARSSLSPRTLTHLVRTSPRVAREALLVALLGRSYVRSRYHA